MNPARENILGRVRAALRTEAPRPPVPTEMPIWLSVGDIETRFRAEFVAMRGELLDSAQQLREFLKAFSKIAIDGSALVRQALNETDRGSPDVRIGATGPLESRQECRSHILHEADLGVTGCDCLIAQTGSIFVTTRSAGGRALSVLPPAHLVIARRDQLVPDLAAAFALIRRRYDRHWPSSLCLITGPSRTADIEKILVMGAHGPKRIAVYFAG
jgi:L-lactate dehydrogenase complex protein LldG